MDKLTNAIVAFEDMLIDAGDMLGELEGDEKRELAELMLHFAVALEAMRRQIRQEVVTNGYDD